VTVSTTAAAPELVAYIVQNGDGHGDGHSDIDVDGLRTYLANELPLHMVPSWYIALRELPLTPSGKLDRAMLPAPDRDADRTHLPPQTETERMLAEIWHKLLNVPVDAIGTHDSFFALGGSSLQATQLISRIRDRSGVTIGPRQLFTSPVLHQLGALVDEARDERLTDEEVAAIAAEVESLSEEELDRLLGTLEP